MVKKLVRLHILDMNFKIDPKAKVGDTIEVNILREGKEKKVSIKLTMKQSTNIGWLNGNS